MPFEIHTPPWTNFHDLNLDWMIQTIKSLETRVAALENGDTPENTNVVGAVYTSRAGSSKTINVGSVVNFTQERNKMDMDNYDDDGFGGVIVHSDGLYHVRLSLMATASTITDPALPVIVTLNGVDYPEMVDGSVPEPAAYIDPEFGGVADFFVYAFNNDQIRIKLGGTVGEGITVTGSSNIVITKVNINPSLVAPTPV